MTTLKIKVTKENIMQGQCNHAYSCAIALALRVFGENTRVGNTYVILGDPGAYISLPDVAQRFINDFDNTFICDRHLIPELEFEVEIPDAVIERIDITEVTRLLHNHPNLSLA